MGCFSTPTTQTFPTTFTFLAGCGQYLNWFLEDSQTLQPIISASITATLYSGRSTTNPQATPGTPVTNFTGVQLKYLSNTKGQYQAVIPASFNPVLGPGYVLVVDAAVPGYNNMHWEVPAVVNEGTVTIFQKDLIVNPDRFRNDFSEFADKNAYPDSTICFWVGVASMFINRERWCEALCLGVELYTAHQLVLEKQAIDTVQAGGWPGLNKGLINNESPGAITIGYDAASTVEESGGHWNLTVYGTRFLRIARMMGAGPIQIGPGGGGFGAAGSVPGLYNSSSPGWSGPPCKPGYLGS
jgi:hypothetical protein